MEIADVKMFLPSQFIKLTVCGESEFHISSYHPSLFSLVSQCGCQTDPCPLPVQRQWDSLEQAPCIELVQDPDLRWAVKRLFSGPLQLPRLSCRPSTQEKPEDGSQSCSHRPIKPSRSLGTLTSCISRS